MKYLLIILFMANVVIAIEQVPRRRTSAGARESEKRVEVRVSQTNSDSRASEAHEKAIVQKKEKQRDRFVDKNSNGVNDRREDDFRNIKTKKSKHKEKFDRPEVKRVEPKQPKRTSGSTRETKTNKEKQKEK
jgi:hypothetical protein